MGRVRFVQKDFGGCCACQPSKVLLEEALKEDEFVALSIVVVDLGEKSMSLRTVCVGNSFNARSCLGVIRH